MVIAAAVIPFWDTVIVLGTGFFLTNPDEVHTLRVVLVYNGSIVCRVFFGIVRSGGGGRGQIIPQVFPRLESPELYPSSAGCRISLCVKCLVGRSSSVSLAVFVLFTAVHATDLSSRARYYLALLEKGAKTGRGMRGSCMS